jgi:hypothetical protein
MRTSSKLSVLACLLAVASAQADDIVVQEIVLETASDVVPLPLGTPTTVVVKNCPSCTSVTLRMNDSTRFFAQQSAVTLPEMRKLCGSRVVGVLIGYEPRTLLVTRFMTSCEPTARTRK